MVEAKGPEGVEALPAIGKYIDPVISTSCARWLVKPPSCIVLRHRESQFFESFSQPKLFTALRL
jgi:hypothetical protein